MSSANFEDAGLELAELLAAPELRVLHGGMSSMPNGFHHGMSDEFYHRRELGVASKSALDRVAKSLSKYKAWVDGIERPATPALHLGKAVHCQVLEPTRFEIEYTAEPEWGNCTKADNKQRRNAWRSERAGRPMLTEEDWKGSGVLSLTAKEAACIRGMVESVLRHSLARRLLEGGDAELSLRWDDADTGTPCKCRVDHYADRLNALADLKSCEDASESGFQRAIASYAHHRQDAFYRGGFAALGRPVDFFAFVACEKESPFDCAVYVLDADAIAVGERQVRKLIDRLASACMSGSFPGYPERITTLSLPGWYPE